MNWKVIINGIPMIGVVKIIATSLRSKAPKTDVNEIDVKNSNFDGKVVWTIDVLLSYRVDNVDRV